MKSVVSLWLAIIICAVFITSCNNSTDTADQNNSVKTLSEYLGKPIEIHLKGTVLDNNSKPLDSVAIIIGKNSTLTDNNGHFVIKNVKAHENLLAFKVIKKGYKNEQINLTPKHDTNSVNITLYKENELSIFRFNKDNHNLPHTIH